MCFFTDGLEEIDGGQATVEAAFLIPVLCFAVGLLLQPAVLLYDRCVMESAATETCRLAVTATCGDEAVEGFARRRLSALPGMSLFHNEACDWEVEVVGGSGSAAATVSIKNHVKILPLLGLTASTLSETAEDGCALLKVEAASSVLPAWLDESGSSPEEWMDRWD